MLPVGDSGVPSVAKTLRALADRAHQIVTSAQPSPSASSGAASASSPCMAALRRLVQGWGAPKGATVTNHDEARAAREGARAGHHSGGRGKVRLGAGESGRASAAAGVAEDARGGAAAWTPAWVPAWETTGGTAAYRRACEGMGLKDAFRLAVDRAPVATLSFTPPNDGAERVWPY